MSRTVAMCVESGLVRLTQEPSWQTDACRHVEHLPTETTVVRRRCRDMTATPCCDRDSTTVAHPTLRPHSLVATRRQLPMPHTRTTHYHIPTGYA